MPNGYSLHIGLNRVDPAAYHGWDGALRGCINDANAMRDICQAQGFATRQLIDGQATAGAVLSAVRAIALGASAGDTVVITYSGHGGQVPDANDASETDGLSETWVCFDRMLVDNELHACWSSFPPGVHVQVYSDSCHSGTVVRELRLEDFPGFNTGVAVKAAMRDAKGHLLAALAPQARNARGAPLPTGLASVAAVLAPAALADTRPAKRGYANGADIKAATDVVPRFKPGRAIPAALAMTLWREHKAFYMSAPRPGPILCGVTLISGCQDNQLSQDGTTNGLFTEKLLQVWAGGSFNGTVPQFHAAISRLMPPDQTPNYDLVGVDDDAMAQSRPLTIVAAGTAPVVAPRITGPQSYDPTDGTPPSFDVNVGPGRNYVVELATDPAIFAVPSGQRAADSRFYGSWQDSPRQTSSTYAPPPAAWNRLRGGARLYFRVGSTTSPAPGWNDYLVSTRDEDASSAPAIELVAPAPEAAAAPTIGAPASVSRAAPQGPQFVVNAGPYYAVEVATDPWLFAGGQRTPDNFFGSWDGLETQPRLQGPTFVLPPGAWSRLRNADRLYYRVLSTTSLTGWDDFKMSLGQNDLASAPSVLLTGAKAAPLSAQKTAPNPPPWPSARTGSRDGGDFDDSDELGATLNDQRATDTDMLSTRDEAHDVVAAFRDSEAESPWASLDRATVADRLDELIDYPRGMQQGGMNLCGPAAFFMMALARDPAAVARCATELFDTGSASLGDLVISPGSDLVEVDFAAMSERGNVSSQAEWMLLGALRNSTSVFWQPSWTGNPQQELAGMSRPEELADWMRSSGIWSGVTDGGKWASNPGIPNAMALLPPVGRDHALLINTTMIARGNASSGVKPDTGFITSQFPNHWVVLLAEPLMDPAGTTVSLSLWTWGGNLRLDVPKRDFLDNYYGAVTGIFDSGATRGVPSRFRAMDAPPPVLRATVKARRAKSRA